METESSTIRGKVPIDNKDFRETLKRVNEKKLEDMRVLIEMELMERDRRS
mgnify:CR=1 FL=1